jgi:hypothetical protein
LSVTVNFFSVSPIEVFPGHDFDPWADAQDVQRSRFSEEA